MFIAGLDLRERVAAAAADRKYDGGVEASYGAFLHCEFGAAGCDAIEGGIRRGPVSSEALTATF